MPQPYNKATQMTRGQSAKRQKLQERQKHRPPPGGLCRVCGVRDAVDPHHLLGRVGPDVEKFQIPICRECHETQPPWSEIGIHRDATCRECGALMYPRERYFDFCSQGCIGAAFSQETLHLLRNAVRAMEAGQDKDIEEWARKLAEDVVNAND